MNCSNCGYPQPSDRVRFCYNCGAEFKNTKPEEEEFNRIDLYQFVTDLLRDVGILDLDVLEPEAIENMKEQLLSQVNKQLNEAVFIRLDEFQRNLIVTMINEGRSQEEVNLILQTFIPDLRELWLGILNRIRENYLKAMEGKFK